MKLLLVTPGFHGYWRSIAGAFGARGHYVLPHVYDDFSGLRAKARNKLLYELPEMLGGDGVTALRRRLTASTVEAVRTHRPQVVVVVKGDVLGDDFWDLLDVAGLPRVLWLYDELRRLSYDEGTLARVGPIASYSVVDAQHLAERGIDSRHVPLAFDPSYTPVSGSAPSQEAVFVGARYPERERTLRALNEAGVAVRAYGRQWSHHPVDRLRTWDLRRPDVPSGRDLARSDAYLRMAAAPAALNMHGDQDGFTMRTFEACGVGGVQLIDRDDVAELYEPGVELATYSSPDQLIELCRRALTDTAWAASLRTRGRARTLAHHTFAARAEVLEDMWD